MSEFHQTQREARFFDVDVPQIIRNQQRTNEIGEKLVGALEILADKINPLLYNVFIKETYSRDTQVFHPGPALDLANTDVNSIDCEDCWRDYSPKALVATVRAETAEMAVFKASMNVGLDPRILFAEKIEF